MTIAATNKDIVAGRAGNTLFVDAQWGEDDPKGLREYSNRPFKTIMAAVNAATAGDTVLVLPGVYDETDGAGKGLVCKDGVSITGISQDKCTITATLVTVGNEAAVTMADDMTLENFTILSDPDPALTGVGLLFSGTSNATSTAKNIAVNVAAGRASHGIQDSGVGVVPDTHTSLREASATASVAGNAYLKDGEGTSRARDSLFDATGATAAIKMAAGTLNILGTRADGDVEVLAAATLIADRSSTWTTISNSGTLQRQGVGFLADPLVTARMTTTITINHIVDTLLVTLPPVFTKTNPALIHFTTQIKRTGGGTRKVTFKLYRDGLEIDATDRYEQRLWTGPAADAWTSCMHWVDESPGENPVYTVYGLADGNKVEATLNRRATVTM